MELNTSVINISLWYNVKEGNQCGRELTLSSSSLSHSTAHVHFRRRSCAVMRIWCARGQLRKQIQRKRLKALYLINPLHPNISVHFLHNFFHTFPMVLTRSIWLKIKNPLVDPKELLQRPWPIFLGFFLGNQMFECYVPTITYWPAKECDHELDALIRSLLIMILRALNCVK